MSALAGRRIGFLGGGNMAEALLRGLLASGVTTPDALQVSDPALERRHHFLEAYGIAVHAENEDCAAWADVVLIAVKPQAMPAVLGSLATYDGLAITIAAGVATATVEAASPARVVRAMPNTPALVLAGATAVARGGRASEEDLALAEELFAAVGRVVRVPEAMLDAVTGLSGSGPAYVMTMIEGLADGGVKMGLPRDVALTLAAQTVYGSAMLQLLTEEHPAVLRDRVTSPGGTTSAGLARLEAAAFRHALIDAVEAATRRSLELGR
ncbi:MAG: pyrroline-5-carboxylate reductase [Deltaproteobacteria bacterium]|nr:pyrroline-5-carboxylate reductase [Deltaproteobacteria bacterium]